MYQRKVMKEQLVTEGVRIGDSCRILPSHGHRKAFTLNRTCIDLISQRYRPDNLAMSYIELPNTDIGHFHYRLELDPTLEQGRFFLRTIKGNPFWLNGSAAKEAYVERMDHLFLDENKMNFGPYNLEELISRNFEHPVLTEQNLLESDLNILIQGETGTGKTHLAQKIHEKSGRPGKFLSVNLSSFNPQLIESELFGHKKGSFTGAIADKNGAFHEAQNGTLFLDEIDSLPQDLQTKLLTFLDNKKFRRVGEMSEFTINSRLIFASGRKLENLVQQGVFRKDFYFRLKSGHTVALAPLRNDINRIKEGLNHYSIRYSVSISKRLQEFYVTLAWPGNLRQLFGHLDKKRILSRNGKLDFDFLDEEILQMSSDLMDISAPCEIVSMKCFKENYVKKVLGMCHGNISATAKKLQVTEKTVKSLLNPE